MKTDNSARAGFIHNRAVAIYQAFRTTAALSAAGTTDGVRIGIGPGCRNGFLSAPNGLDNSHYLPGGLLTNVFHDTDAYRRLRAELNAGQWSPPSAWHTSERPVSTQTLPPGWVLRNDGVLAVPMYEIARSTVGRDAIYKLSTGAEAQERAYNRTADKNEEGTRERQSDPGLKEAFSESLSLVQMLTKGATAAEQNYWALEQAKHLLVFFEQCTRDVRGNKSEAQKHTTMPGKKAKLEEACNLLTEDLTLLAPQIKEAKEAPSAYFQNQETDRVAIEIEKAERAAGKNDQAPTSNS